MSFDLLLVVWMPVRVAGRASSLLLRCVDGVLDAVSLMPCAVVCSCHSHVLVLLAACTHGIGYWGSSAG